MKDGLSVLGEPEVAEAVGTDGLAVKCFVLLASYCRLQLSRRCHSVLGDGR
jgi:hypothetical protein